MAINRLILEGRITNNGKIEVRQSGNGSNFGTFTLGVYKGTNDKGEHINDFFDCVVFGKTVEYIQNNLAEKGRIIIEGSLNQNKFVNKEGKNDSRINITVQSVEIIDRKQRDQMVQGQPTQGYGQAPVQQSPAPQAPVNQQVYAPQGQVANPNYAQQGQQVYVPQGQVVAQANYAQPTQGYAQAPIQQQAPQTISINDAEALPFY